jgi:hypothetical protein
LGLFWLERLLGEIEWAGGSGVSYCDHGKDLADREKRDLLEVDHVIDISAPSAYRRRRRKGTKQHSSIDWQAGENQGS